MIVLAAFLSGLVFGIVGAFTVVAWADVIGDIEDA